MSVAQAFDTSLPIETDVQSHGQCNAFDYIIRIIVPSRISEENQQLCRWAKHFKTTVSSTASLWKVVECTTEIGEVNISGR